MVRQDERTRQCPERVFTAHNTTPQVRKTETHNMITRVTRNTAQNYNIKLNTLQKYVLVSFVIFVGYFAIPSFFSQFWPTMHTAVRHGIPSLTSLPKDGEVSCHFTAYIVYIITCLPRSELSFYHVYHNLFIATKRIATLFSLLPAVKRVLSSRKLLSICFVVQNTFSGTWTMHIKSRTEKSYAS